MTKTALLVIDAQIGILDHAYMAGEVLAKIAQAQMRARDIGSPVLFLQHNHISYAPLMKGAATWAIHPSVAPAEGEGVIEKTASDGFWETSLEADLRRLGVTRLAVAGLQTEFCVDATCRSAMSKGFDVVLLSDAHTTLDGATDAATAIRHHNYALSNLAHPTHPIALSAAEDVDFA